MNIRTYINKALKVFKSKIDDNFYNKTEVDHIISNINISSEDNHSHVNKIILDNIGESADMLTYKGKVLINNNEYSLRSLPTKVPKSKLKNTEEARLPWLL